MKQFLPSRSLSYLEWLLVPEAFSNLVLAWIKVNFLPSKKYLSSLQAGDSTFSDYPQVSEKANRVTTVIQGLSSRTPWLSTCLIQALAAQSMLQKRAISNTLHFGVSKKSDGKLEAHAWVSVKGQVLLGAKNIESFVEIKR